MANIEIRRKQELARLRRFALGAQGLLQATPFGRGVSGARKAIVHMGYVQIDTISVVERAHHHVFRSRVPNFKPQMTDRLLADRSIFEYWAHAAAFLPMQDYRYSLPYKEALRNGQTHWSKNPDHKLMAEILARIVADGPLRSRDLEPDPKLPQGPPREGWWDWKPAKRALEQLYMHGELMVSAREGFQKTYDLTERVIPADIDTTPPSMSEFAEHLLEQQLRCHAFASLKGITYLRRNAQLRTAVKGLVEAKLASGELDRISLPSGEQFICRAGLVDTSPPRAADKLRILSPFDNAVIQRDRLKSIFEYDYQIECYVPAPKREFGYFCLPLLYRDQFVGRVDCKAHRARRELELKALHFGEHKFDEAQLIDAFADAIVEFRDFQNCDTLSLTTVDPAPMRPAIERAIASL
jgi:uncharacterized protein YcaQ